MKRIDALIAAMVALLTSAAIFHDAKGWLMLFGVLAGCIVIIEELVSQQFEVERRRSMPAKDYLTGVYHRDSKDLEC